MVLHAFAERRRRLQQSAADAGIDVVLVTPGPDLRYLTGYDAVPLERLTCLLVPAAADPVLVVPALERPAAQAGPAAELDIVAWEETDDPFVMCAHIVGPVTTTAVDDRMWAEKVLRFRAALPAATQVAAGSLISTQRMRKDAAEIAHLAEAAAAIDEVHAHIDEWLRPGRTEHDIAVDIDRAIIAAGHARTDFVIVASGPNGASPHHEPSQRVVQPGDTVVVDIGGTMPSGYCSDCTRTYAVGEPDPQAVDQYTVLHDAQQHAVDAVRPGVTAESVDVAARAPIVAAGWGPLFVHRTGHGIGVETHEQPYIVEGNATRLEPGMAFSVEPGIYDPGRHGARLEDIVVVTEDGVRRLNTRPRDLVQL